jgi:hypothetical protein
MGETDESIQCMYRGKVVVVDVIIWLLSLPFISYLISCRVPTQVVEIPPLSDSPGAPGSRSPAHLSTFPGRRGTIIPPVGTVCMYIRYDTILYYTRYDVIILIIVDLFSFFSFHFSLPSTLSPSSFSVATTTTTTTTATTTSRASGTCPSLHCPASISPPLLPPYTVHTQQDRSDIAYSIYGLQVFSPSVPAPIIQDRPFSPADRRPALLLSQLSSSSSLSAVGAACIPPEL